MKSPEQLPDPTDIPVEKRLKEFSLIDDLPEESYDQIHAKWEACNNAIFAIGEFAPQLHNESGSNSLDDQGAEQAEDTREQEVAGQMMAHFRSEMVRLGDLLESKQKAA